MNITEKYIKGLQNTLNQELKEDILDRYDNKEYHYEDIK